MCHRDTVLSSLDARSAIPIRISGIADAMVKRWIGRAFLQIAGWKTDGERPSQDRYVIIAAPHTSNWDMPFMLAMAFV